MGPVLRIRQDLGLSAAQLAMLAGVRPNTVYLAETGVAPTLPQNLRTALVGLGYDEVQLLEEQAAFHWEQRQALVQRLQGVGGSVRSHDGAGT